jgi:hypothetical protein
MNNHDVLQKILDETHIIMSALEAEDIDIALGALERRNQFITQFTSERSEKIDAAGEKMIRDFESLNVVCIEKLTTFKSHMEIEMYANRSKKIDMKQTQKVHEQYSNPYVNDAVGNAFDLKK